MFIGLLVIGSCFVEYVGCWFIGFLVEFGGKNFMIVVWGVNFDKVVKVVICVCFLNVGQLCIFIEWIYVEKDIVEEFIWKFGDVVWNMKFGIVYDFLVDMGSLIFEVQLKIVFGYVDDVMVKGVKVIVGGKV